MNKVFIFKDFEVILGVCGAHVVVLCVQNAKPAIVAALWRAESRAGNRRDSPDVCDRRKGAICHIAASP